MTGKFFQAFTSFIGGEWTPELEGRVDLAAYPHACSCLVNYLVRPQGGVERRPGTKYVAEVKNSACQVRLMPMSVSANKHYMVEVGTRYLRFYESSAQLTSGGAPLEVQTPFDEADLFTIHPLPSVDVMYLLHKRYQTQKLERFSDTCFRLRAIEFTPPASVDKGTRPSAKLIVSATSGDGVVATTQGHTAGFTQADCGRTIVVYAGCNLGARAGIASFDCPGRVLINICSPWVSTNTVDCSDWRILGPLQTSVDAKDSCLIGKHVNLTLGVGGWRGNVSYAAGFPAERPVYSDIHKFAIVRGGVYEILSITSCTVATAAIRGEASSIGVTEAGAWTLEEALWSNNNGWPETGAFLDGRMYLGTCHRFAASKVGDYENFAGGVLDDDGLLFAIDADTLQQIRWMRGLKRGLLIGTVSGEYEAVGGNDNPITPDNIHVERQTNYGSSAVEPVVVGNVALFATRSSRRIRELVEDPNLLEGFIAPDIMVMARHLTERATHTGSDPTIVQMAYQQEPDPRIWVVLSNGVLAVCAFVREHKVIAWSRCITEGSFESVAIIPHPDGNRDQVWVAVRRTINGQTKRYIEYLDDAGVNYQYTHVDAAFTCARSVAACVVYGIGHLECARVVAVGDGSVFADQSVVGGNITLDTAATNVEVGLPYDSVLTTMRPEVPSQEGSSQMARMRWVKLAVRLLRSIGLTIQAGGTEETIPWRTTCDLMDCAPQSFTGLKEMTSLGWDCGKVTVRQNMPLPSAVLSISGSLEIGGGS